MTYGLSLKTSRGYAVPEVGAAYARARELCRQVADPGRVIPVLIGMSAHHIVSGEIETSRDVALEMLELFNRLGDPNLQMIGQWSLGTALFHLGELEVGHEHLRKGLELYDPSFHKPRVWETGIEPGIFCRCEYSRTLMLLGYPDQGLVTAQSAVSEARALENPQTLAFALLFQTLAYGARRQPNDVLRSYEELSALCSAHGIAQEHQWAVPLRGRARVELGDVEGGLPELALGLEAHTITRSALLRPYYFVLYAGALLRARKFDLARAALDEACTIAETTNQHAYDAEHRRLLGEVYLAQENQVACERAYKESLAIARRQGARWLELRAARGYARFLLSTGRASTARDILRPICEWFTEGRETLDYIYAEALLRTLDGQPDRPDW
jgi:adenylate cyclase